MKKIKMKKIFLLTIIVVISNVICINKSLANSIPILPILEEKSQKNNYIEGEIVIQYKNKEKQKSFETKIKSDKNYSDLEIKDKISNKKNISLLKSKGKKTQELIEELKKDSNIEIVEPNYKRNKLFNPNDTNFAGQWSLRNTGQSVNGITGTADADIDADEMWDIESSGAQETIVAVIDDGVDYTHSDLINNMWDGSICLDDLENPIIGGCPNHGWDYQDDDNNPYFNEHGTFVSSIVASQTNNSSGMAGLSRYNKIKIMAIKFDFDLFTELKAIDFAINNGAKVINASYSGPDYSLIEQIYIESFDGIFVAAAGNASNNNDIYPEYPCSYDSSNIICVASSDQNDQLSDFSNYGPATVDIMAPGENMMGLYKGSYYIGNGTSFSAPLVAGTTALLYSQNPTANINTIRDTLLKSSDHLSEESIFCNRRLNAKASLQSIINNEIPSESCSELKYKYLMWTTGSTAAFWKIDSNGRATNWKGFTAAGWTPKSYAVDSNGVGYLMWANGSTVAFWKVNPDGSKTSWVSFTAAGWTPKSYAVDSNGVGYLMWANGSTVAFWKVNPDGSKTSWVSFTAAGWTPTSYSIDQNNIGYLMWTLRSNTAFWKIDSNGNATSWKGFAAIGWTPKSYTIDSDGNGYLMWANGSTAAFWKIDSNGNATSWKGFAAIGWTPEQSTI